MAALPCAQRGAQGGSLALAGPLAKGFTEVQAALSLWEIPVLPNPPAWSRQESSTSLRNPKESLKQIEEEDELSH